MTPEPRNESDYSQRQTIAARPALVDVGQVLASFVDCLVVETRPKGDSVKVALAARLRAETTITVGWIAERLAMGTRGYLNHLLYRRRKLGGE